MSNEMIASGVNQSWESKKELIKATVCKGATDDELELFLHVCKKVGLDPLQRQIYSISRNTKTGPVRTIQASIDGLRLVAERTGNYAPGKESTYTYEGKNIVSCTAYVMKRTDKGEWHEVSSTVFFDEFAPRYKDGALMGLWSTMPHVMVAKCAESQALRKAFPANISGIYSDEEMGQADVATIKKPLQIEAEVIANEPLSIDQIKTFASEIVSKLSPLIEQSKESQETVAEVLGYYQERRPDRPIRETIEKLVAERPETFLEYVSSWKTRSA